MDALITKGVAFITGCGSGIGLDVALAFSRAGCRKLFLVDISAAGLEKAKAAAQSVNAEADIVVHTADISDEAAVKEMVEHCVERFGRIDFAVNNAGVISGSSETHNTEVKDLDRLIRVNARGTFLCEKYELQAMLKQEPLSIPGLKHVSRASIVNTSSMAGLAVMPGVGGYSATKHGLISMSRVDARSYAEDGIRINSVCPGFVDTPMFRGEMPEEFIQKAASQSPMKRLVDSSEVANAILFLSGSLATAITGISLPVDCGALLYRIF